MAKIINRCQKKSNIFEYVMYTIYNDIMRYLFLLFEF